MDGAEAASRPLLEGMVVVESSGALGAYCGRLLALLGAEVIKLEPPDGDPLRHAAPLVEGGCAESAAFLYNNLGKRSICLDLRDRAQRAELSRLLERADVFLSSLSPAALISFRLDPTALVATYPRLVVTAVTYFGLDGPHRDYEGTDITALAAGGQLYLTGYPDRRPVKYGGYQAYKQASVHAAYGTLLALLARRHTGRGQVVDVSAQECIANSLQTTMQLYDLRGEVRQRVGTRLLRCKDGYIRSMAVARGLGAMLDWFDEEGFPHTLRTLEWSPSERPSPAVAAVVEQTFEAFVQTKTKTELFAAALERGIALTPVQTALDVLAMPGLEERDFWTSCVKAGAAEELRAPSTPFRLHGAAMRTLHAAPPLGEETVTDILGTLPVVLPPAPAGTTLGMPLEGTTVLDFTWFGAGSMATRVLAHYGAQVIKVESTRHVDGIRLSPPFRAEPGINLSGFFNNFNSGKLSLSLDLQNERGAELAARLVRHADVVADNFSPGVLARFGLSDERIHELNPRAVVLHMPMGGLSGDLSRAIGFGATIEAVSGLVHMTGDPDRDPVGTEVNYPDYGPNPYHAATAVLAALYGRETTSRGCVVELSQIESTISFSGEALLEAQIAEVAPERRGNWSGDAIFSEVLRCAGEDAWCAVACRTQAELDGLLEVAGLDATAPTGAHLVEQLGCWSSALEKYELAALLQRRGVPAYPAVSSEDLLTRDPQLRARGHYVVLEHPAAGLITHDAPAVKLSATPGRVSRPAPCLGEHTADVLSSVLGLTPAAIDELAESGALV